MQSPRPLKRNVRFSRKPQCKRNVGIHNLLLGYFSRKLLSIFPVWMIPVLYHWIPGGIYSICNTSQSISVEKIKRMTRGNLRKSKPTCL
jgi:hypothetical protein